MTDPRIEAVAAVLAEVTGEPRAGRFEYTMARAALAAADNAATITTVLALLDRVEELEAEKTRWRNRAEIVATARNLLHVDRESLVARAEAAEKKVAAVEALLESYGEQSHECGSGDCCRCTLDDFRTALDGGA